MSVAKVVSKAVGKVRKRLTRSLSRAEVGLNQAGSMLRLGVVDVRMEQAAATLHNAAILGTKAKLKRVLNQGTSTPIDAPNSFGQTPLFCACAVSNEATANLLLQHRADPNVKDHHGVTPVHVVCYTGNVGLLCRMIEEGGDVGVTDDQGQGILEWAAKNKNFESKNTMMAYLQLTPLKNTSRSKLTSRARGSEISLISRKSAGFGQAYPCDKEMDAIVSIVPVISETKLKTVDKEMFRCSLNFSMRGMLWHTTEVCVKTVETEYETKEPLKMILSEASFLSKLRHPNVIMLMALCQPQSLDGTMLVLEKVHKNMYHFLHVENAKFPHEVCVSLALQISSGMGYIHDQGFLHCALTSHAVYLAHNLTAAKLGNLEFMLERSHADKGVLSSISTHKNVHELYHWMAPEIIAGNHPDCSSDFFSFCCLLWEMFTSTIPWSNMSASAVRERAVSVSGPHPLPMDKVPEDIVTIIDRGVYRREQCMVNFDNVYSFLKDLQCMYRLNRSHNSLPKNTHLMAQGQSSSQGKGVAQDKLVFTTRKLQRSYQSTPAIATNTNTSNEDDGTGLNKMNCSDGDIQRSCHHHHQQQQQQQPAPGSSSPLIKPASHRYQSPPGYLSKPSLSGPSFALPGETKDCGGCACCDSSSREGFPLKQTPCSVRQLADDYQQIITQHKLRQEILKGSMAPHGGWDNTDVDSPLNSTRWHSLPSTIRELSKMWSPEDEMAKTGLSDLANLSCTPQAGQTSTPLRRGGIAHGKGGGVVCNLGLVDFFKRQRNPRDVRMGCEVEEEGDGPLEEAEQVDSSTKLKAAILLEEMKTVQSMWRQRVLVDEEEDEQSQSIAGVSYHSPVIEVHKRRTRSVTDDVNYTFLETGDDHEGNASSTSPGRSLKGEVDEEQIKTIDVSFENFRRNLRERRLSLSPTRSPGVSLMVEEGRRCSSLRSNPHPDGIDGHDVEGYKDKDGSPNDIKEEEGMVGGCSGGSGSAGPAIDSFWDLTTHWPKVDNNGDSVDACLEEDGTQEWHDDGTLQRRPPTCPVTGTTAEDAEDAESQMESGRDQGGGDDDGSNREEVRGGGSKEETTEAPCGSDSGDVTFCIATGSRSSRRDGGDPNTTFTFDADGSETDSWFPDTVPPDGSIAHRICSNVENEPGTKWTDPDEVHCGNATATHPRDDTTGVQEVKVLEDFEFQEFYIDDDLDTSENIQPVTPNGGSPQPKDGCHDCPPDSHQDAPKPAKPSSPPPSPSPPSTHKQNPHKVVNHDVVDNSKLVNPSLPHSESEPSVPLADCQMEEVTADVKDKIALFDVKSEKNSLVMMGTHYLYTWTEKKDSFSCKSEKMPPLSKSADHNNVTPTNYCVGMNHPSDARDTQMERSVSCTGGKARLIPKIKEEEIKKVKSQLSSTRPNGEMAFPFQKRSVKADFRSTENGIEDLGGRLESNDDTLLESSCVYGDVPQSSESRVFVGDSGKKDFNYHEDASNIDKRENEMDRRYRDKRGVSKESFSMHSTNRSIVSDWDGVSKDKDCYEDCESDDWLSSRLHSIQEKIRRRRERSVYTVSSEDEEGEDVGNGVPLPYNAGGQEWGGEPHVWDDECAQNIDEDRFKWNMHLDDCNTVSQASDYNNYKMSSVSSSERLSLPQSMSRSSFSQTSNTNRKYCNNAFPERSNHHRLDSYYSLEDENNSIHEFEQRQIREERLRKYKMSRILSQGHYLDRDTKSLTSQRSQNSQSSRSKSMDNVKAFGGGSDPSESIKHSTSSHHGINDGIGGHPTPRPRSIRGVKKNESRSSVRTVMFEDETDGLKQYTPTPTPSSHSQDFVRTGDGVSAASHCGVGWMEDGNGREYQFDELDAVVDDDHSHSHSRNSSGTGRRWQGKGKSFDKEIVETAPWRSPVTTSPHPHPHHHHGLDETFDVIKDGHQLVDGNGMKHCEGGEGRGGVDGGSGVYVGGREEMGWSRRQREGTSQHCLTLGLGHDNTQTGGSPRDKLCKIGDNVYTEVHRFYIPKSKWPDGCKTRFHLDLCPTNPRRHRISTTAIDPVTGRQEVLMEKTVDTDRLKSHITID